MNLRLVCFYESQIAPPTATAQQKGIKTEWAGFGKIKVTHYKKRKVKNAETLWHLIFAPARSQFKEMICRPVKLEMIFCWKYPNSIPKSKRGGLIPRPTKPDLDNIEKSAIDVLADMEFFNNDSRIFSKNTEKYWAPFDGVVIRMWEDLDEKEIK